MSDDSHNSSKRLLDPMERISEVLFGLIMVLTFTCSFSVAEAGRQEVRTMLEAALGCNLAWGMIDAVFYLMGCLSEQGHNIIVLRAVRKAADPAEAHRLIADALPPRLASVLPGGGARGDAAKAGAIARARRRRIPGSPRTTRLAAAGRLPGLVFPSTFPVVVPFVFLREPRLALRVSNAVAIAMLFMAGYAFGRYSGFRPMGRSAWVWWSSAWRWSAVTIVSGG